MMRYDGGMNLRDRKRARVRQALVDAATELFERDGYERTTVADIAAAADIGTRTFFSYFASKEELLFPESDHRVQATVDAIAARDPEDSPVEVLVRALYLTGVDNDDLTDRLAALRLRLIREVPAVRGRALQIQLDAQQQIAAHLAEAFPDQLDKVTAGAMVGAFVGAVTGAVQVVMEDLPEHHNPKEMRAAVEEATSVALRPWMAQRAR
ncbi:TetR family transcriptional regulator [Dactylosporangium aurantiacum]|uniref:TetR family transcriptional regulator n=2 Tax=Dactylosporangium aurantiacum TaxID=35754 RepID=A0A9Q9IKM8_9ACTN|nr:TetR family transcriptional regulator [Dactylosporangium aurantiacum]